jgi:Cu(I)/Ag(I) efflux system periplasmic protein CusF
MKPRKNLYALSALLLAVLSFAGPGVDAVNHAPAKPAAAAMADGEVKKIDREAGKITIKHGPLTNLDMPAMTMVFRVNDPGMLDRVQAGDKIKFAADKVNGAYTVVQLAPAQ